MVVVLAFSHLRPSCVLPCLCDFVPFFSGFVCCSVFSFLPNLYYEVHVPFVFVCFEEQFHFPVCSHGKAGAVAFILLLHYHSPVLLCFIPNLLCCRVLHLIFVSNVKEIWCLFILFWLFKKFLTLHLCANVLWRVLFLSKTCVMFHFLVCFPISESSVRFLWCGC